MGFIDLSKRALKKMSWVDVQCIKTSAFLFGLVIGAYLAVYIVPYWWVVVILAVLAAVKPIKKAF